MNGIHVLNLEELVLRVERRKNRGFSNWYMRDRQSRAEVTWEEFCRSLADFEPPARLSHALAGLCWDAKVDCKRAHESAQRDEGKDGSWVHAYLHRKEGDQSKAAYWYSRAGEPGCREPLDAEWLDITKSLLGWSQLVPPRGSDSSGWV